MHTLKEIALLLALKVPSPWNRQDNSDANLFNEIFEGFHDIIHVDMFTDIQHFICCNTYVLYCISLCYYIHIDNGHIFIFTQVNKKHYRTTVNISLVTGGYGLIPSGRPTRVAQAENRCAEDARNFCITN